MEQSAIEEGHHKRKREDSLTANDAYRYGTEPIPSSIPHPSALPVQGSLTGAHFTIQGSTLIDVQGNYQPIFQFDGGK